MKQIILHFSFVFLISFGALSQATPLHFYKTYEDYLAGKPVSSPTWTGMYLRIGMTESIEIKQAGKKNDYEKVKNLQELYWGVTDQNNRLMRFTDNHLYYVLAIGDMCLYAARMVCEYKDGNMIEAIAGDDLGYLANSLDDKRLMPTGAIGSNKALKYYFKEDTVRMQKYLDEKSNSTTKIIENLMLLEQLVLEHNEEYKKK